MRKPYTWTLPRTSIELGRRTVLMGILNVTPDSFSDGGSYFDRARAVEHALELEAQGADIIDVGGESTRPGSQAVAEAEELRRVVPVIESLGGRLRVPISVDTYRSAVLKRAMDAGAQIVNDISAFRFDAEMGTVAGASRTGVVMMHSRGSRDQLHAQSPMTDPVEETITSLKESVQLAMQAGVSQSAIVIDPGIGFGKRADESLQVLQNIWRFTQLEYPVLVGTSRKSFLGRIVQDGPDLRLWGTAASVATSIVQGAHVVRVHDVRPMRTFVDVMDKLI